MGRAQRASGARWTAVVAVVPKGVRERSPVQPRPFEHVADASERLAKSMALATEDEVKDLKRSVRRLEEELTRMKNADSRKAAAEERPSTRNLGAKAKKNPSA